MQFTSLTETSSKDGLTIIWSKRGGDIFAQSHSKWLQTVVAYPDSILQTCTHYIASNRNSRKRLSQPCNKCISAL
ncbi:hypothetical protein P3S67_001152 [Capsicum chacoense]